MSESKESREPRETTVTTLEWNELCRHQSDILALLRTKGVTDVSSLAEITEYDVRQLRLKDLVVRRRLMRAIQEHARPLPSVSDLSDLCCHHTRSLNLLHKAGIHELCDLHELEPEDLSELELQNLPVWRRLHRYLAQRQPTPKVTATVTVTANALSSSSPASLTTASSSSRREPHHRAKLHSMSWSSSPRPWPGPRSPSVLSRTSHKGNKSTLTRK